MNNYEMPYVIEKGFDGSNGLTIETKLFNDNRTIYLDCPIDSESALSIIKQIQLLSLVSKEKINLIISSPGGDIDYGLSIIDAIDNCGCKISAYALGRVASMASLIFVYCDERIMYKHSKLLFHNPFYGDGFGGDLNRIEYYSACLTKIQSIMTEIIKENSKLSDEEIKNICNKEQYMNPEEALQCGLIDRIEGETDGK